MTGPPPLGRVYRMVWWFRILALFFLAIGAFVVYEINRDASPGIHSLGWTNVLGTISLSVAGLYLIARAFTSTLEFSSDRITQRWVLNTRSLEYALIGGRREFVVMGEETATRYLRLETTDGGKPFDVGKNMYAFDDDFWNWYRSLPDLDAA